MYFLIGVILFYFLIWIALVYFLIWATFGLFDMNHLSLLLIWVILCTSWCKSISLHPDMIQLICASWYESAYLYFMIWLILLYLLKWIILVYFLIRVTFFASWNESAYLLFFMSQLIELLICISLLYCLKCISK